MRFIEQNIWIYTYDNKTSKYRHTDFILSKSQFLQRCEITAPLDIHIQAFVHISQSDPTCILFDS